MKIKVLLVVLLFGFCSFKTIQSFFDFDSSECLNVLMIQYDQSELLKQQVYQDASFDIQLKMMQENFYKQQNKMHEKFHLLITSNICTFRWDILKPLPLAILGYKLRHKLGIDDLAMGIGLSTTIPHVASEIYQFANTAYDCAVGLVEPYIPDSMSYYFSFLKTSGAFGDSLLENLDKVEKIVESLNLSYIKIKPKLSTQLQRILEKHLAAFIQKQVIDMAMNKGNSNDYEGGRRIIKNSANENGKAGTDEERQIHLMLDIVLNLPQKPKSLVFIPEDIKEAFSGYRNEVNDFLKKYCIRQVAASRSTTVRKLAAYFWGPPGTGKTRAAGRIAQALSLPFETISLSKIAPEDLIGTGDKPGLLLDVMTRAGRNGLESFNNMVLLLDDADRVLNEESHASSFILNLLEPETKSFYSPFLKSNVDISHLCIILAGNSKIKDEALFSRLQNIEFEGYDSSFKKQVAHGKR